MPGKNVVLVEGTDDEHVVKHLCAFYGLPHLDKIDRLGGVDNLIESFPVRLKESDVNALGVVVDADTDLDARFRSLRDLLVHTGYSHGPEMPSPVGTIFPPPAGTLLPRVGLWLMPDNSTNGILEDFIRILVPSSNPLFLHVERSVDSIPSTERLFSELSRPKAVIHTWLAWQREPGRPIGTAITARYLDASVPQVGVFINWLRQLFWP
ncbi:MAG: DUF3226 domain-containing protein [Chloroflexota bacterium]